MKNKSLKAIAVGLISASHAVRALLALSLFLTCFLSANSAAAAPVIQLMTPQSGPVGTMVAIVGTGFGASQGTSTVTFNGTLVTWVSWSATSLQVQVPVGATSGSVVVTVSGKGSNSKSFTVTPPPAITGLSPSSGPVGATITITGSNFTAGGTQSPQVVFNPELFASPISSTDTSISVAVPAGAATGDLLVSVGGGNSNAVLFNVTSSGPSISSLTPGAGVVGTAVTITGTNFGSSKGTSTVTFNGATGIPTSWSATSIYVPVPAGATTGNVLVTVGGVESNPYGFEVGIAAPNITSISPTSGAVATSVTIKGTGFGSTQGTNTVNFNGVSGVPTSWSATQIKVPVPTGATTGNVVVTASGTVSNGVSFTVPGTGPSVTSLSPSSGPVGTSVTITGTNFGATQGASTVTFNGLAATATGWSPTSIVATVPSGATVGSVVVTVSGTVSNGFNFTVAPSITSLSPTSGAGGVPVTITGTSFGSSQGTSTVTFNGTAATPTAWGPSSITLPAPTGASTGNVFVTVSGVLSNGVSFTVLPTPSITGLSPSSGSVGTSITISGTNFGVTQGSSTVTFNGTAASPTSWGPTSIVTPVPSATTTGNIVVTVNGVASAGARFTVATLTALSISPTSSSISVGKSLQLTATGTYSDGSAQNLSSIAIWTSSAPSVATISPTGLATGAAVGLATIQATVGSLGASATLGVANFTATGSMSTARSGNTQTVLNNGTVLVAGGNDSNLNSLATSEIYNPATGTFVATGNLIIPRSLHTATLLNNGTVMMAGGSDSNGVPLSGAELYDPVAGTFSTTGNLNTARYYHTATLLRTGKVLIAGGIDINNQSLASAELFDPVTGTFALTGNLNIARLSPTATMLNNGQVLLVGGLDSNGNPLASAELYDPVRGTFSQTGSLSTATWGQTATLLNNGQVLLVGGDDINNNPLANAELYDPASAAFFSTGKLNTARVYSTATLLNNGTVLVVGGANCCVGDSLTATYSSAELYDPVSQSFIPTSSLTTPRYLDSATLLNNGTVLVACGTQADGSVLASAELYQPATLVPANLVSIAVSPSTPSIAPGAAQSLTATGTFGDASTQTLASVTWNSSDNAIATVTNDSSNHGVAFGVASGSATVSACTGAVCGSVTVSVASSLVSITVSPQSPTMPLGTTLQFTATGTYSDGSTQDLTSTATWTSSSSSATVSNAGLVSGVSLGASAIQAISGSLSASTNVTVGAPALLSLALSPSTATIAFGASQQFQVIGTYTDGSINNLTNLVSWFAVPSETASVNFSGLVMGLRQGTAAITASNGTLFAIGSITVQAPAAATLVSIVVTPSQVSIPIGSSQQFIATGNYSDGSAQDLTSSVIWTSSSSGVASVNAFGLATATTQGTSTLSATSGSFTGTATISVEATTLALNTSRYQHSATLLNNGSVLIAGGVSCASVDSCTYLNSAELYNPNSGTITFTGNLAAARSAPAVLLGNGKVLVAGGYSCDASGNCASLSSAEIYDPNSSVFSSAGNMTMDRFGHTVTLLANGKVLIAGGQTCSSSSSCNALNTAELYDPVAGTFTTTGSLNAARFNASAAVLSSGKVLIAGGFNGSTYPAAAELYDPVAGSFSTTGSLNTPRANATANWLENSGNMVLIAGGSTCNSPGCPTAATEYYQNGYFYFLGNMTVSRLNQTATLLTNGQLFLAGGLDSCVSSCMSDATTELYNPQTYSFTPSQALTTGRSGHTATLLTDGSVLLVGGINNGVTLANTDSYQPTSFALPQLSSIKITPSSSPVAVGSTLSLVATGYNNGSSIGALQPVIWNSSSPSVASVSNAAGSAGIVEALSPGTATITGSVGTVSSTSQITVTPVLVSITVTPLNPSIPLNSSQLLQLTATGNYSDGSSSNLTSYVTWTNSSSSVAKLMPNLAGPGTEVVVIPVSPGNTNFTAAFTGVSGSTTVSVLAPPTVVAPSIDSVTPAAATAGAQVTITGSGFGAAQGTGTIWLGTTLGTVVSWSDGQVVATVNTGSASGTAQILQNGVASNAVPFTVNAATISSVTPTSGIAGTQVTITGSGFGAAQGSSTVWLGNAPGMVTSWSDGQVVATVASGAASGTAQILQNGVWSNSVPFTINLPHIATISPNSGAGGTVVTITGNGFGATQGSGVVWIGSTDGFVTSWSDTQVVASVASSSLSGIAKIQQNGTWSNAVTFTVPAGGGTSVTLNPNLITMLVGATHAIQSLNASGQPVTGLTWASSNTLVATLSTDDPPIINAVAAGKATITAGNASADITVVSGSGLIVEMPVGTVLCKNPGNGAGVISIIPAVPSPSGVADVFALQADGNVLAISSDCLTAWTAFVGTSNTLIPDFQGGLIVAGGQSIYKLDGITGQAYPAYTASAGNWLQTPVPHTDGTIFAVDGDKVVGINPLTGRARVSVQMDDSTFSSTLIDVGRGGVGGCYSSPLPQQDGSTNSSSSPPNTGTLIIAGDGYAYIPYIFTTGTSVEETNVPDPVTQLCTSMSTTFVTEYQRLLRVGTSGDSYSFPLGSWSSGSSQGPGSASVHSAPLPSILWAPPITNADTGVLFSWSLDTTGSGPICPPGSKFASGCSFANTTVNLTTTAGSTVASQSTISVPGAFLQPVLQRTDGSYIGADLTGNNMFAFTASGTLLWTTPNDYPQIATSDGGVIGYSGVTYDQNGNANGQQPSLATDSWIGNTYQVQGAVDQISSIPADYASTYAALGGGNQSSNGTAIKENPYPRFTKCVSTNPNALCPNDSLLVGLEALQSKVGGKCLDSDGVNACVKYVFNKIGSAGDQQLFSRFINRPAEFYDGTKSTLRMQSTIGDVGTLDAQTLYVSFEGSGTTVAEDFAKNKKSGKAIVAIAVYQPSGAQSPVGQHGLRIFFDPSLICTDSAEWDSTCQILNQSTLFHEGLHEFYGLSDPHIQNLFHIPVIDCTGDISDYITFRIYGKAWNSCAE